MLRVALILCFVGCSFQGGVKPQQNPGNQPEYVQGAGFPQGVSGPLGSKAGGLQNGYGGLGQKSGKLGLSQLSQPTKHKPGYGNILAQGIGAKPSKAGYGKPHKSGYGARNTPQFGAQTGYGAGNYPQYGDQTGFGVGNFPQYGAQAGYGNSAGLYPSNGAGLYPSNGAGLYPSNGAGLYPSNGAGLYPSNGAGGYPSNGAGPYPSNGAGGYPSNGAGLYSSNGAGLYPSNLQQQGYGAKPSKAGIGAGNYQYSPQRGYRNGYGGYPSNFQQPGKSGKPSKAGYGIGAGFFPSAAGLQGGIGKPSKAAAGYPNSFPPQGLGSKPSKSGLYQQPYPNGLSNFQGNGKGIKSPLSAYQGPAGENSKPGAYGKLPYRSQPVAADSLGYDTKSSKLGVKSPYGSQAGYPDPSSSKYAGQVPFSSQPVLQSAVEDDVTPAAPVEGMGDTAHLTMSTPPGTLRQKHYRGGYQQLGGGQAPWTYAPEESSYGQTGFYGNGYRGCSGKC